MNKQELLNVIQRMTDKTVYWAERELGVTEENYADPDFDICECGDLASSIFEEEFTSWMIRNDFDIDLLEDEEVADALALGGWEHTAEEVA